jgi:NADPH2:quinone reductase
VRAAILSAYGQPPEVGERQEPQGDAGTAVVELAAAALNPADLAIASGSFPAGSPPLPYVPGIEGVGRVVRSSRFAPGTRVWASGRGLGVARDGAFAERFAVADEVLIEVPDDVGDVVAAALGQVGLAAVVPLSWLAPVEPGEAVLVLGATGSVGTVAVQVAKLLGAGRVVAAGRNARRLESLRALGADATVVIGDGDLRERLDAAADGSPPSLVLDLLWGAPLEAAVAVAAPGARIVHVGQSAGPSASLHSGHVRGKQLRVFGYSNFAVPLEELARGYAFLLAHAAAGRIRLAIEALPLEAVSEAWERQRRGSDAKLVLVPRGDRYKL